MRLEWNVGLAAGQKDLVSDGPALAPTFLTGQEKRAIKRAYDWTVLDVVSNFERTKAMLCVRLYLVSAESMPRFVHSETARAAVDGEAHFVLLARRLVSLLA